MVYIEDGNSPKVKALAMLDEYSMNEVIGMFGQVLVSFEGKFIREGTGCNGNILANLDGNFIREGNNTKGRILAEIDGNEIKQSDIEERLLFKIEGFASKIEKAALTVAAFMLKGQI